MVTSVRMGKEGNVRHKESVRLATGDHLSAADSQAWPVDQATNGAWPVETGVEIGVETDNRCINRFAIPYVQLVVEHDEPAFHVAHPNVASAGTVQPSWRWGQRLS